MDDHTNQLAELPLDTKLALKEWLQTTRGRRLSGNLSSFADELRSGGYDRETLVQVLCWTQEKGRSHVYGKGMPPWLYALVFGKEGEKELHEDKVLKELLLNEDPINFILNSCAEPPKSFMPNATTLMDAFVREFRGNAVSWMEKGLQQYKGMYDPEEHYGRTIAVVQSSGTGKSRMMAEMAKKYFTVSVCFRGLSNAERRLQPTEGWPPRDDPACFFFSQTVPELERKLSGSKISPFKGEEISAAFLGGLLAIAAEKLEGSNTPLDFIKKWGDASISEDSATTRQDTFLAVQKHSGEALENNWKALLALRGKLPGSSNSIDALDTSRMAEGHDNARDLPTWCIAIHDLLVHPSAKDVYLICQKKGIEDLLLVFDKCTQLNFKLNDDKPVGVIDKMSLMALERMLKAGDRYPFWTFLLDTHSGVDHDQPRVGGVASSARLADDHRRLPVFPYMEFDVMLEDACPPQTPMEALRLENLKMYGRPFWSTLTSNFVNVAIMKLICAREFCRTDENHVFAVFSARLLLELGSGQASNRIASHSLRHHMRVLMGASSGVVSTCAPSEPMLAIAAAHLLNVTGRVYQEALQYLVHQLIIEGVVLERGMQGELLARILLMVARDRALVNGDTECAAPIVQQPLHSTTHEGGSWVKTVTLKEFLTTLVPGIDVSYTSKRNRETPNMLSWANQYHLNFTHFIQLTDIITRLSPEFLFYCWCRGVALQCTLLQPVFDVLIVIYSGNLDKPFNEENLGLVTIQVKLRVTAEPLRLVTDMTCPVLYNGRRSWRPPHMVVLMELGAQQQFQQKGDYKVDCGTLSKNPKTVWEGYNNTSNEPGRYSLHIRGHKPYAMERMAPDIETLFMRNYDFSPEQFDEIRADMEEQLKPLAGKAEGTFWSGGLGLFE